jgi:CheY-like chemotaxis protein
MFGREKGKKMILVVDDEFNVRQLVRRILCKEYEVLEAQDGQEAVKIAFNNLPNLILMDMLMPHMDGLTACLAIKNNKATENIPVFMLTAMSTGQNEKLAEEIWRVDKYLTKPIDSQSLLNLVREKTR